MRSQLTFSAILLAVLLVSVDAGTTGKTAYVTAQIPSAPTSVAPKVSPEFAGEVGRIAAGGLRLKEALEANLSAAGTHHLLAVFERVDGKNPSEAYEFRILEGDGKTAKTLFTRKDFFFSFAASSEMAKLSGTDINGDGLKEIFVQSSSGGNCWSCNPVEIYQLKDHQAQLIAAEPIQKIIDLNNDRIAELVIADARWEFYGELAHAASPSPKLIYTWRGGRYVQVSRDFADFYKAETERLRAVLTEAKAQITDAEGSDDAYVGTAITLAITFAHAGDKERGLTELETLLNANARTSDQKKRRADIMKDFRSGDSAKKLTDIKYGDPLS